MLRSLFSLGYNLKCSSIDIIKDSVFLEKNHKSNLGHIMG